MSNRRHGRLRAAILAALSLASPALAHAECSLPQPFPPCSANRVTVSERGTMTLSAGTYGTARVRNGGTLILQEG